MANEISVTVQLRVQNGSYDSGAIQRNLQINQSAALVASGVVSVTTNNTALTVGSVTTYGIFFAQNLDSANFVTLGSTANLEWKMKAGETFGPARMKPAANVEMKADTATCKVAYWLFND